MNTDLFGQPIPDQQSPTTEDVPDRITNDIDEVAAVLRVAVRDGYAVVGARQQVWRRLADPSIEPVPRHEADIVRQLLDAGWLVLGGAHVFEHHAADVGGRSVLVPRRSRQWLARWTSRKRLGQPVRGGRS